VKHFHKGDLKTLKKEIEEETKDQDFPSWIGTANTVKMTVFPKAYANEIPIKFPMIFFTELEKKFTPKIHTEAPSTSNTKQPLAEKKKTMLRPSPYLISKYTPEP